MGRSVGICHTQLEKICQIVHEINPKIIVLFVLGRQASGLEKPLCSGFKVFYPNKLEVSKLSVPVILTRTVQKMVPGDTLVRGSVVYRK